MGRPRSRLEDRTYLHGRVLSFLYFHPVSRHAIYHVVCDGCGEYRKVFGANIKGSLRCVKCRDVRNAAKLRVHGHRRHPLYHTWSSMRSRCRNPEHHAYHNYGGRGIQVSPLWDDFPPFISDVGERPPGLMLDRIDNNGNYEPGNVRWATKKRQMHNRRKYGHLLPMLGCAPI